MKHTQGPWKEDKHHSIIGGDGKVVTVWGLGIAHGVRSDETEGNAQIMKASKQMYDTLLLVNRAIETLHDGIGEHRLPTEEIQECLFVMSLSVDAAIAQAEGRT